MAAGDKSREAAKGSTPARRRETKAERADRNMGELLQELRVALPGVQVLFAFLLTVPFAQGFPQLTETQKDLYFGVLISTAVSTAFLIAPSALHRLLFRQRDKEYLVTISSRFAVAGLVILGFSITGAVLLIADFIFDGTPVWLWPGLVGALLLLLWVLFPLYRRMQLQPDER
jgi:hypothetical protein